MMLTRLGHPAERATEARASSSSIETTEVF
jgi:hypothetical protein